MTTRTTISLALPAAAALLLLAAAPTPAAGQTPTVAPGNTGLPGTGQLAGRDTLLVVIDEEAAGVDLNGDGDLDDRVPHVEHLQTGASTTLSLAVSAARLDERGRWLTLSVSEFYQGSDLNGDGDTSDNVAHLYEIPSGTLDNLGLAVFGLPRLIDGRLQMTVLEDDQGVDANGDGDTLDRVFQFLDLSTGNVVNTGLAITALNDVRTDARFLAIVVDEEQQGQTDLDSNGTVLGGVVHFYELATGVVTNGGLRSSAEPVLTGGHFVSVAREASAMQDLDGDGVISFGNGFLVVLTRAGTSTSFAVAPGSLGLRLRAAGRWVWLQQASLRRLSLATQTVFDVALEPGSLLSSVGPAALLRAREEGTDLNGDGDGDDEVLHVVDAMTGQITNIGLSAERDEFDGDTIAAAVPEAEQGQVDRNLDGDLDDSTLAVHDLAQGTTVLLPYSVQGLVLGPRHVAFSVDERDEGDTDLNGDGDAFDKVLHVFDQTAGTVTNLGAAVTSFSIQGGRMVYRVSELSQGGVDLNGDGDGLDDVIHVIDL